MLLTKRNHHSLARTTVEIWLASQPDEWFLLARDKIANPQIAANYERIVELYVLHILPTLEDWESARQFLEYNDTLQEKRKQVGKGGWDAFGSLWHQAGWQRRMTAGCSDGKPTAAWESR